MMDDDALLSAVAAGDDQALRALFERHAPWVAGRLRRAPAPGAVEDVVQERFLAVWRGAAGYQGGGEVGGWIWGIAEGAPGLPLPAATGRPRSIGRTSQGAANLAAPAPSC